MDLMNTVKAEPVLVIMRNVPTDIIIDYAKSIIDGGVNFFEVALNSKDALNQITMLKKIYGDRATIGAGTAITVERAKAAIDAGADFLLAPSTDEPVLAYCQKNGIALMPGALTPSDVSLCVRYGFNLIKLFPAGDMPRGYIKSLKGPFDDTDYVAIGGVNKENAAEFIKQGYLGIGLGSNLLAKEVIANRDWETATKQVAALAEAIKNAK